ncbi:MAG TPA: ATP-binding protein [Verrucomicrobiae bacterium]
MAGFPARLRLERLRRHGLSFAAQHSNRPNRRRVGAPHFGPQSRRARGAAARFRSGTSPWRRRPGFAGLRRRRQTSAAAAWPPGGAATRPRINLFTNAIHYNKPGGEIRVSTRAETGSAILTVADTGIGISAENLPHVFERFYRADKSRSRAEGHSGLGLAICQAMVAAHEGSIEVSSQLGVGATFTLRLPPARSSATTKQQT